MVAGPESKIATDLGAATIHLLTELVEGIGTATFSACLSELLAAKVGTRLRLAIQYARYGPPVFQANSFIPEGAVATYLDGLWRIDPLQRLSRDLQRPRVVRLRAQSPVGSNANNYLEELFKLAFISDELAMLLPVPGGGTLAICCDRQEAQFSDSEHALADALLPLVTALHCRHLAEVVRQATSGKGTLDPAFGPNRAVSISNEAGSMIYASEAWERMAETDPRLSYRMAEARQAGWTRLKLPDAQVVHWEQINLPAAGIRNGAIALIEVEESARPPLDTDAAAARFCQRHGLTPREADIVNLILLGFPNSAIAAKLGVTAGTVKNHRWRIYTKLDITTERELFLSFLASLLRR